MRIEKDRRGLGLSVAGGAIVPTGGGGRGPGLVRIRRLYAAQPAWATGQLRPGDLLLAANGISLAGLTTYVNTLSFVMLEIDHEFFQYFEIIIDDNKDFAH